MRETLSLQGPRIRTGVGTQIARDNHHIYLQSKEGGQILIESDKRVFNDRRRQPTPGLSQYIFRGRRKAFRRRFDQQQGGYVDRYSAGLFFPLILIAVLNVSDSLFTMMILDNGGEEVNPIVCCIMEVFGDRFWVWKFIITSFGLILLCLHSRIGRVKAFYAIVATSFIYVLVLLYQIHVISQL